MTDRTGHPLSLQTQAFYRSLHQRLQPGGVALFNLIARGEQAAYIASICRAFADTELMWTPARGNVIVVAMPAAMPDDATLRARARQLDARGDNGFSFNELVKSREPACQRPS